MQRTHLFPHLKNGGSEELLNEGILSKPYEHRLMTMQPYRIDFSSLDWQSPMEGVRQRVHTEGKKKLRLVEYSRAMPPHWCSRGHAGMILDGSFEIEFDAGTIVFREGDGVFIPDGETHRHRARAVSDVVRVVFVEDV